jgi:hypothetical protein
LADTYIVATRGNASSSDAGSPISLDVRVQPVTAMPLSAPRNA